MGKEDDERAEDQKKIAKASENEEELLEKFSKKLPTECLASGFMEIRVEHGGKYGGRLRPPAGFIPVMENMAKDDVYHLLHEKVNGKPGKYYLYPCNSEKERIEGGNVGIIEIEPSEEEKELDEMTKKADKIRAQKEAVEAEKELTKSQQELDALKEGDVREMPEMPTDFGMDSRLSMLERTMERIADKLGDGGQNNMVAMMQQQMETQREDRKEAEKERKHEIEMYAKRMTEERNHKEGLARERRGEDDRKRDEKRKEDEDKRDRAEEKRRIEEKEYREEERKKEAREEKRRDEETLARRADEKLRAEQLKIERDEKERRIKILEEESRDSRKERAEAARRDRETQASLLKAISEKDQRNAQVQADMMIRAAEQQVTMMNNQTELVQHLMGREMSMIDYIKDQIGIDDEAKSNKNIFGKIADSALKVIDHATGSGAMEAAQQEAIPGPQQAGPNKKIIPIRKQTAVPAEGGGVLDMLMAAQPKLFQSVIGRIINAMDKDLPARPFVGMLEEIGTQLGLGETVLVSVLGLEFDELKTTLLGMKAKAPDGTSVPFLSEKALAAIKTTEAAEWWGKFQEVLQDVVEGENEVEEVGEEPEVDETGAENSENENPTTFG